LLSKQQLKSFSNHNPLLLYGLSAILGSYFFLLQIFNAKTLLIILCAYFLIAYKKKLFPRRITLCICVFVSCYFYTGFKKPHYLELPKKSDIILQISSLHIQKKSFSTKTFLQGNITSFENYDKKIRTPVKINCRLPYSKSWFLEEKASYHVSGSLQTSPGGPVFFTPSKNASWIEVTPPPKWAIYKKDIQKFLKKIIYTNFQDSQSRSLMEGMITGVHDNEVLKKDLFYLGLTHLLAISGFHFSLLALFCLFCLRPIFSDKILCFVLTILFFNYAIFVDFSPSVCRAFIMASLPLWSCFNSRRTRALNALGGACLVIIILDPGYLLFLGFQFSFLITASILACYSFFDRKLLYFLPSTPPSPNFLYNKVRNLVRQGCALNIAVSVGGIPLSLVHFGQFPILSLVYNFFIPTFVSLSLMLFLTALLLLPITSYLSSLLFKICDTWTTFVLHLITPPKSLTNWIEFSPFFSKVTLFIGLTFLLWRIFLSVPQTKKKLAIE
jgi:competence protein ComEC